MIIVIFLFIICFMSQFEVLAILDGRTGNFPIELDTTYTFSNFEWARGYVKFRNGFDVPPNGTIFLGVNQEIEGPVTMNGGTIILERDMILHKNVTFPQVGFDPNFFKTNDYAIFIRGNLNLSNQKYFFSDSIILDGLKTGVINAQGIRNITAQTNNTITLRNMFIFAEARTFTFQDINNGPFTLNIKNVSMREMNDDFSFLNVFGSCRLIISFPNEYRFSSLRITKNASLLVSPLCELYCNQIILEDSSSLILDNAQLSSDSTSTLSINGSGNIFIKGQSSFKAGGDTISVAPDVNIILRSAARLTVDKQDSLDLSGAHLIIN